MRKILLYYMPLTVLFLFSTACPKPETDLDGEALYIEHCQDCHGQYGTGTGISPSIQDATFTQINNAIEFNPQMQDLAILTQDERFAISDFLSRFNLKSANSGPQNKVRGQVFVPENQGVVTLIDATNHVVSADSNAISGTFTLDITDMEGPYLLRFESIDGSTFYASATTGSDVIISEKSDLMVRECFNSDDIEKSYSENGFTCDNP